MKPGAIESNIHIILILTIKKLHNEKIIMKYYIYEILSIYF